MRQVEVKDGKVHLSLANGKGPTELIADHMIGGTGYRIVLRRLPFLDDGLRKQIRAVENTPILNTSFQSSVPGLYFVAVASANSFGPMARFAYGAGYTSHRLSKHWLLVALK